MKADIEFDKSLGLGMTVWVRWVKNNLNHMKQGVIIKLNVASLHVQLENGDKITVPRATNAHGLNKKYNANNGVFPLWMYNEEGWLQRMVRCPKCTHDNTLDAFRYREGGFATCSNRFCGKRFAVPPKAKSGHHMVPCPGEAHTNAHIDYCMMCMPRWGWLEIPEEYATLEEYRDALHAKADKESA